MSTLSVPLTPELERFINEQVRSGRDANKAAVVRRAVRLLEEEVVLAKVLKAEREPTLRGDLRTLLKKIK